MSIPVSSLRQYHYLLPSPLLTNKTIMSTPLLTQMSGATRIFDIIKSAVCDIASSGLNNSVFYLFIYVYMYCIHYLELISTLKHNKELKHTSSKLILFKTPRSCYSFVVITFNRILGTYGCIRNKICLLKSITQT